MAEGKGTRNGLLLAVASGALLNPLNSSMISLALPRIQSDFRLSFATVSWLISSYYLSSAIAQPVMGKLGDQVGRKTMFMLGLLLVAASALAAPWAPSLLMLLLFRLFQSVGSSAIYPSGISIVRDHIRDKQASALAIISVCTSAAAALGPTIGGILVGWGDWPAIFTVNFPILLISFLLGWLYLPAEPKREKKTFAELLRKLDLPGIALFAFTTFFLLWLLLSFETRFQPVYIIRWPFSLPALFGGKCA